MLANSNGDRDEIVRASNLLSRLFEQPVLSRKPEILLFLHNLAEGHSLDLGTLRYNGSRREGRSSYVNANGIMNTHNHDHTFEDAFSPNGLPPLPTREEKPQRSAETVADGRPRHRARKEATADIPDSLREPASDATDKLKPDETTLLRDLPFTLQGLSSTYLPFPSRFSLDLPPTLPLPVISLLHTLAEPSLLYRGLSDFVESRDAGLVGQSLRSAIGLELRSYLGLIATLEGEIRRAIASVGSSTPRGAVGKAGVTLKRCVVWTRDATMGLRLVSLMADEAKSAYPVCRRSIELTSSR